MSEPERFCATIFDLETAEDIFLECVLANDFDRVTAERDALAQNLKFAEEGSQSFAEECDALQRRLTAADERVDTWHSRCVERTAERDLLKGRTDVLEGLLRESRKHHGVMLMSDPPQDAWKYHRMNERIDAAPKPAEGVGDDTTLEEDREDFKKVFVRINTKQGQSISLADMIASYEKKP